MHKPVWIYWETANSGTEPPYITLCRWTMLHNWSDANLIFLNRGNIDSYVPGLSKLPQHIEVDVKGRLDKWSRQFKPNKSSLAVKCDVYRANILKEHGGIYCDASAIALNTLNPYFDIINQTDRFLVSQRQSHNKEHYPVSFFGCKAETTIITEYVHAIKALLKTKNEFHYNEIGASCLTPIVNAHRSKAKVLDEREIMPITFEDCDELYLDKQLEVESYTSDNQSVFKLFNNPFKTSLAQSSIKELYYSDYLISKLFRHALPEEVFSHYYSKTFG